MASKKKRQKKALVEGINLRWYAHANAPGGRAERVPTCALCDIYADRGCGKCPAKVDDLTCNNAGHPYKRWFGSSTPAHRKQNAVAMRDHLIAQLNSRFPKHKIVILQLEAEKCETSTKPAPAAKRGSASSQANTTAASAAHVPAPFVSSTQIARSVTVPRLSSVVRALQLQMVHELRALRLKYYKRAQEAGYKDNVLEFDASAHMMFNRGSRALQLVRRRREGDHEVKHVKAYKALLKPREGDVLVTAGGRDYAKYTDERWIAV